MTAGTIWFVIVAIGVLAFCLRLSFIYLFGRMDIPPMLRRALRFVPVAVIPALVLPAILIRDGSFDVSLGNERMIAGALAAVVAWRTRNMLLTISAGMISLWILQGIG